MTLNEALNALQSGCDTKIQAACDYLLTAPHRDAIPILVDRLKHVSDPDLKARVRSCLIFLSKNTPSLKDPYGVFRL